MELFQGKVKKKMRVTLYGRVKKKMKFFEGEALIFKKFFSGRTHILWKSSRVDAILFNLQALEENIVP